VLLFDEIDSGLSIDNIDFVENMDDLPNIEVKSSDCKIDGSGVSCNIDLMFDVALQANANIDIIYDISETELEDMQDYSIVIYIVKKGDTLWQIAKRFRSTVDDIARVNGIENPDTIMEGEKLYIPKTLRASVSHV
jgi:LysM repeat protein